MALIQDILVSGVSKLCPRPLQRISAARAIFMCHTTIPSVSRRCGTKKSSPCTPLYPLLFVQKPSRSFFGVFGPTKESFAKTYLFLGHGNFVGESGRKWDSWYPTEHDCILFPISSRVVTNVEPTGSHCVFTYQGYHVWEIQYLSLLRNRENKQI